MNYYIVKKGDTLWGISRKFNITVKKIAEINELDTSMIHKIRIGQKIYIRSPAKVKNCLYWPHEI